MFTQLPGRGRHPQHRSSLPSWILAATASFAPLSIQAAPAAQPSPERVSATVKLADLDLSTSEGMQAAHARLKVAARRLCSKVVDSRGIASATARQECSGEALAEALRRLGDLARVARS